MATIQPVTQAPQWTPEDLRDETRWISELSPGEIAGLCAGLAQAKASGKPLFALRRRDFPFGQAEAALQRVIAGTQRGLGLYQLRGIPVGDYSEDDMRLLYWGVGLHLGVARPQGKMSQFMSDVKDMGGTYRSSTGRGYNTNSALDFHADGCDLVGLLCLRAARSGGSSLISSSVTAHNRMLRERPDLVEVLYRPFIFSRQGEQAPEEPPYYEAPIFSLREGQFACRHVRNHIKGAQAGFPELPRLTAQQSEALDYFDQTLARDEVCFHTYLRPGDMQFLNNHVVLHSRTDYEDWPEAERKRHLLRLWLALPQSQPLPLGWAKVYKDVEPGAVRGGFRGVGITPEIEAFERGAAADHGMAMRVYADRDYWHAHGRVPH